jgi:uncharacterized protein (DUF2267 family)
MQRSRTEVLRVLRNAGMTQEADELASQLPDVVEFPRDHELFERYRLNPEELVSRMGGSP